MSYQIDATTPSGVRVVMDRVVPAATPAYWDVRCSVPGTDSDNFATRMDDREMLIFSHILLVLEQGGVIAWKTRASVAPRFQGCPLRCNPLTPKGNLDKS